MKPLTPTSDIKPITGHKRMRSPNEGKVRKDVRNTNIGIEPENNKDKNTLAEEIESGKYGSATGAIKNLLEMKEKMFNPIYTPRSQVLQSDQLHSSLSKQVSGQKSGTPVHGHSPIVILDSDDEEIGESTSSDPSHSISNTEPVVDIQVKETDETYCSREHKLMERQVDDDAIRKDRDIYLNKKNATHVELDHHSSFKMANDISGNEINDKERTCIGLEGTQEKKSNQQIDSNSVMLAADNGFKGDDCVSVDMEINNDDTVIEDVNQQTKLDKTGFYGDSEVEDGELNEQIVSNCDDLEGIWKEMNFALELSKVDVDITPEEHLREEIPDCDHSFVLKEDLGYVCRVCGLIQRRIETIIEYQFAKNTRSTRTYYREAQITNNKDAQFFYDGSKLSGQEIPVDEFNIHPLHMKQMKPHQLEGFQFLQNNLVIDNPGGCILAHAPGSGKTFMIISFIQSFLAKYPQARPLVVLPKGILSTWKNEFKRWQIEDIPLYDFYSMKADSRVQQLEVLKQWAGQKSILFIGYQQFSLIVCDDEANETTASCQKFLLQTPSILILDEGHTPRNEETDVLSSLKKVQTPRKVVLSGTLYQNHVKEVFNIFDLVRPKFLKQPSSRAIIKRILSKVSSTKKHENLENSFYESVESTLRNDNIFKRKIAVIQDLREMTSKVLHFYKGDFLDELPGILDFTVYLKLSKKQKEGVKELKKLNQRFKVISEGCALYVHPNLRNHLKKASRKEREGLEVAKMDQAIDNSDINDGVKSKFFLNLLSLCESTGEKLLVFGQYIQPLKFLERLTVKSKGWCVGKEIFVITGDSSSESRDSSMEQFNKSAAAKVFFGSIKACGEGISLVGASRIIILDVHLNPSVTRQAIGRAFRPGQERKVYVYRLVAAESPEEDDHSTCFRKESIAKMWFEWNECCGEREFEMRSLDVRECGDEFLESPKLSVDIKSLYQR